MDKQNNPADTNPRFSGIGRLYGKVGLEKLQRSHVCVIGIGGVGSWAVEALARSGVGQLTLIDLDEVCVSNVNRQLHALDGEIGKPKVEVMAQRVRAINPDIVVHAISEFFTESTAQNILATRFDYALDAIDNVANKCLLLAACRDKGIPIVTTGGAGGRRDPTRIRVADLSQTTHDKLLQAVRKKLRDDFGFPLDPKKLFGIPCVFTPELPVYPQPDGSVCAQKADASELRLNCDSGYGTATFVTGTFGFAAAAQVVAGLVKAS